MSQSALAAQIGVKYQQIQRYENGVNRISASRLLRISQAMGVPLSAFLPDAVRFGVNGDVEMPALPALDGTLSENVAEEGRIALQAFFAVKSPELRMWLVQTC